jgi:hypothetical protein
MTADEVIAKLKECAAELGHVPNKAEFLATRKVPRSRILKHFGTYRRLLAASGFERESQGGKVSMRDLFLDWARIVRTMGKIPTLVDYEQHSRYSSGPLISRFHSWRAVPEVMLECSRKEGLEGEWQDVLDICASYTEAAKRAGTSGSTRVALDDRPAYGRPLPHSLLSYAPTNEAGVAVLFGSMARELGFVIQRVQTEFPDCEAMREVDEDRWQRVRIEFEFESHSFVKHLHPVAECDLIVCWRHNWPACPLEVIELQSMAGSCQGPQDKIND